MGRVHPAGRRDDSAKGDELVHRRQGAGLIFEARGHAHGPRLEPVDQAVCHRGHLLRGRRLCPPPHRPGLDRKVRCLRHEVVGNPVAEDREIVRHAGPVPTDVGISVENLQVVLHLAQPIRLQRRPAEAVRRHQLRGDAVENTRELVASAKSRQLGVDVHIDEPRGDDPAFRVDDTPGGGVRDAVDRGDLSTNDADVQAGPRRAGAIDDIAAGDEDVELQRQDSRSSLPA